MRVHFIRSGPAIRRELVDEPLLRALLDSYPYWLLLELRGAAVGEDLKPVRPELSVAGLMEPPTSPVA